MAEKLFRVLVGAALGWTLLLAQAALAGPIVNVATAPQSRAVPNGTAATFFVLMVNSGDATATNCGVFPPDNFNSSTFQFYALDSSNAITGAANQPVDIPANTSQNFLLTITQTAGGLVSGPFKQRIHPLYHCDNYQPLVYDNVNDIILTVDDAGTPTDGLIALQTLSNDGIASIANPGDVTAIGGAFVDISGNTASSTVTLTPSVVMPGSPLPAQVKDANGPPAGSSATLQSATSLIKTTICLTDSTTGQCLSPPTASVQIQLPNGTAAAKGGQGARGAKPQAGSAFIFTFTVFVQTDPYLGVFLSPDYLRLAVHANSSGSTDNINGFATTALRAPGGLPDNRSGLNDLVGVYSGVVRDVYSDPFANGFLPFWMQIPPDGKAVGVISEGVGRDSWGLVKGDGTPRPFTMDISNFNQATGTFSGHIQSVSDPANSSATPFNLTVSGGYTPNEGGRMTGSSDTPSETSPTNVTNLATSPNLQMTAPPATGECSILNLLSQGQFDVWVDGVLASGTVTIKQDSGTDLDRDRVFSITPDDVTNGLVLNNPGSLSGKHVSIFGTINESKDVRVLFRPGTVVQDLSTVDVSVFKAKITIEEVPPLSTIISMNQVPPWQIVDCTTNSFTVLVYDAVGGKGMVLKFVRHTP